MHNIFMNNFKNTIIQLALASSMLNSSSALASGVSQDIQKVLCRSASSLAISQQATFGDVKMVKHKNFPNIQFDSYLNCRSTWNEKWLYQALSTLMMKDGYTSLSVLVSFDAEIARSQFVLKLDFIKWNSISTTRYAWFNGDTGVLTVLDPNIEYLEDALSVWQQKMIASTQRK
jgi:hypothetical protein